jgi:ubiquitin-conjugating enzyme E2 variant
MLSIHCGEDYPDRAPKVKFISRINLPCVKNNGELDVEKFAVLREWKRSYTIEHILVELRKEMASPLNKKLSQPPEGSTY